MPVDLINAGLACAVIAVILLLLSFLAGTIIGETQERKRWVSWRMRYCDIKIDQQFAARAHLNGEPPKEIQNNEDWVDLDSSCGD